MVDGKVFEVSKDIYHTVEANAPQLQEAFGNVGYQIMEKGTYQYLTERKTTE